jgi:hypothetical protein
VTIDGGYRRRISTVSGLGWVDLLDDPLARRTAMFAAIRGEILSSA